MNELAIPQPGILAIGTSSHNQLEFDLVDPHTSWQTIARPLSAVVSGVTTAGGCNVVIGIRPQLWRRWQPENCPDGLHDFTDPVVGDDGFAMPATQHDVVVWVAGGGPDVVFDEARRSIAELAPVAVVALETVGWSYHGHFDLTGFVDGTENPDASEVLSHVVIGEGPGLGGSVLLLQRWLHDSAAWEGLTDAAQSAAIGRDKATDAELDPKPASAHAARTDQDEVGHILRRNVAYGNVSEHGTLFIGLCHDQSVLHTMLQRMAGQRGEPRDELTRYTSATSGSYYFVPAASLISTL
ncbi:MAG: Dyp-type peroxidase [Nostocoides sp.]